MMNKSFVFAAIVGLASPTVSAYSAGQFGYTGRDPQNSCLFCHGSKQYSGIEISFSAAETMNCVTTDDIRTLPVLGFGESMEVTVTVTEPSGGDAPACPNHDCCDAQGLGVQVGFDAEGGGPIYEDRGPAGPDDYCTTNLNGECSRGLAACEPWTAGFNMEVVGSGLFSVRSEDDNDGVYTNPAGTFTEGTQVTHVIPKQFEGGSLSYSFVYTAPAEADFVEAPQFYLGVNVSNGNGYADDEDLNANAVAAATIGSNAPAYCAVCDNGLFPDENGNCPACACVGAPSDKVPAALALVLVGLGLGLSPRRRRN